ncbi:hypothetical protein MNBD_IGNAVI01-1459 [hydrothermal vent metagenome]|uniref:Type II/III secretion system secretin-like domain-containing protein n=1 Tax=hydrothermal vent metagenome TaxID=652676 RepID=A0A3B1C0F2_9ZZZZ
MKTTLALLLSFLFTIPIIGQKDLEKRMRQYVNPEEIVTLAENIPFDKAIEVLSKVSQKTTGKKIVLTTDYTDPIGIEITRLPFKRALNIITQYHDMVYEETADNIVVKPETQSKETLGEDIYADVDSREIKISALFFEANITEMKERGINWELLLQKTGLAFGANLTSFTPEKETQDGQQQQQVKPQQFILDNATDFNMGDFSGNIVGAFKFFESNGLGELIARPSITVRDKAKGRIQIGEDISIKERDFSGNLIDRFYSTGTIVEVTPHMYTEDKVDYVLLQLQAERSSAEPGEITTTIRKTVANTEVLMLDGEETVIGGLFTHNEITTRSGIPFLRDLPWWVFGIRYLTGSDKTEILKREIIILIKIDIVPPLKERIAKKKEDLIKRTILENRGYIDKITKEKLEAHKQADENTAKTLPKEKD